jgi:hypothetical protein
MMLLVFGGFKSRKLAAARLLLFTVPLLIAMFVLHVHGEALTIVRIARMGILVAFVAGAWWLRRRREAAAPTQAS